ncbi:unnamed protein product [Leuciscus chuanchicus]
MPKTATEPMIRPFVSPGQPPLEQVSTNTGLHFDEESIYVSKSGRRRLKSGTTPSRFSWNSWGETRVLRQSVYDRVNARFEVTLVEEFQNSDSAIENADEQPTVAEDQEPASDHNYTRDSAGGLDADAAAETIRQLEAKVRSLERQLRDLSCTLNINRYCATDEEFRFYTRFQSEKVFWSFWESVAPSASRLVYWSRAQRASDFMALEKPSPNRRLALVDELFLYCCRVAVGMKEKVIADIFGISLSTRQLFHRDGHHPNKLGSRVLKDNIYFSLNHPSAVCANPLNQNGTHTPGHSMNDHRTSLQNGHDVDISHKDNDNTTEPQQPLLTDTISAKPCPQSSPQTDTSELLQDSAPKDDFLENSQGSQDSISQPPITPEQQPLSPDTFSLSPPTPLLCFSQKMEELVHAGTRLSHSFAASPQISTKKRRAPLPPKPAGPAHPPPASVRALRPLPQRQGPHPPPSARGEPKTTDTSSQ